MRATQFLCKHVWPLTSTRYSKHFTVIEPTLFNVCQYWFNKDQNRLRDIRPDSLAQIVNLANIRPGGRYIAVDDASGVVVSAILDRMGGKEYGRLPGTSACLSACSGQGRLVTICDIDSPPAYPVMVQMNFRKEAVAPIMVSLNWAAADEDYTPSTVAASSVQVALLTFTQSLRLVSLQPESSSLMVNVHASTSVKLHRTPCCRPEKSFSTGSSKGLSLHSILTPSSDSVAA